MFTVGPVTGPVVTWYVRLTTAAVAPGLLSAMNVWKLSPPRGEAVEPSAMYQVTGPAGGAAARATV